MTKTLFTLYSSLIVIAACTASKKSTTSTSSTTTATTTTVTTTTPTVVTTTTEATLLLPFIKPADGIYPPRTEELIALQAQYKSATLDTDVTLEKLKEGYNIYAKGACTKCHEALNIYYIDPFKWRFICENMALRANLSQTQKDAVYQYVLSIKATQSK